MHGSACVSLRIPHTLTWPPIMHDQLGLLIVHPLPKDSEFRGSSPFYDHS